MEGEVLSHVPITFSKKLTRRALTDTGACANAFPEDTYKKLKLEQCILKDENNEQQYVKLASGMNINVIGAAKIKFSFVPRQFEESFIILQQMKSIILGNPFFKEHAIQISPSEGILKFPDMTLQLNEIRTATGTKKISRTIIPVKTQQKYVIHPKQIFYLVWKTTRQKL